MAIKENVLVIGANSFIGRAITKKCIQNNWNVFCCSKKKVNKFSNNKKYNFIKFDSEKKKLSKKINKNYKRQKIFIWSVEWGTRCQLP